MKELLSIYTILPIVYFMYRAGELAAEKGYRPIKWQTRVYVTTLFGGFVLPFFICLISLLVGFKIQNKSVLVLSLATLYLIGVLTAGFALIPHLKNRKSLSENKRTYREYNLKNAFLFPRVIPRGGFLWRTVAYWILMCLLSVFLELASFNHSPLVTLPLLIIALGIGCFGLLYFLSHICIPRIRDAGLSRDTFILLFFPGLGQIAFLMLLTTPTRVTSRSSI